MIKAKKSSGVLSQLLAKLDKTELEKAGNRMMIAAKIGNALEMEGLSQKDFAAKMGRTESEISNWLSGDRNFTIDTLTEISMALDITLLDTSVSSTCTVPIHFMSSERKKDNAGVAETASWTYSLGYIDCRVKGLKVG